MKKKNEDHLNFVRTRLPCCVCLDNVSVEAAHIRFSDAAMGKVNPGMGAKAKEANGEDIVVPLCGRCHRKQHEGNEKRYWRGAGINPVVLSRQLREASGDAERCEKIIRQWGW